MPCPKVWLNETGTLLAVVGKEKSTREQRSRAVRRVFKNNAPELQGEERDKALREFLARDHWLRGAAVDQLSRREAGIVAERLMLRLQARLTVPPDRIKVLKMATTEYFKPSFIDENQAGQGNWREELLKLGREHLNEQELTTFRETLEPGYRPQPGEK
jgi:hypothetical protein